MTSREIVFLLFFAAFDLLLVLSGVMILGDLSITENPLFSSERCGAQFGNANCIAFERAAMNRGNERTEKMGMIALRQKTRSIGYVALFLLGLCCVFSGSMAWAQLDQGAINGVVKDATGAVIPHAQVSLKNTDTNFVLQSTADGKGQYSFSRIKMAITC